MNLADHQTPSKSVRTKSTPTGSTDFPADTCRLQVVITAIGGPVEVAIGDPMNTATYFLKKGEDRSLPAMYIGGFTVRGAALVTEFLTWNSGV